MSNRSSKQVTAGDRRPPAGRTCRVHLPCSPAFKKAVGVLAALEGCETPAGYIEEALFFYTVARGRHGALPPR
jgi:hypothetical protein